MLVDGHLRCCVQLTGLPWNLPSVPVFTGTPPPFDDTFSQAHPLVTGLIVSNKLNVLFLQANSMAGHECGEFIKQSISRLQKSSLATSQYLDATRRLLVLLDNSKSLCCFKGIFTLTNVILLIFTI